MKIVNGRKRRGLPDTRAPVIGGRVNQAGAICLARAYDSRIVTFTARRWNCFSKTSFLPGETHVARVLAHP